MALSVIPGDKRRRRPTGVVLSEQEINTLIARDDGEEDSGGESDWDNLGEEEFSAVLPTAAGGSSLQKAPSASTDLPISTNSSSIADPLPAGSSQQPVSSISVISDVGVDALFGSCRSNLSTPREVDAAERRVEGDQPGPSAVSLFGDQSSDSDLDDHEQDMPRCEDEDELEVGLSEQGACISRSLTSARRSLRETKAEREVEQYLTREEPSLSSPSGQASTMSSESSCSALAACAARRKRAVSKLLSVLPGGARTGRETGGATGAGLGDSIDSWVAVPSRLRVHRPRISSELWLSRTAERQVVTLTQFISRQRQQASAEGPQRGGRRGVGRDTEVLVGVIGSKLAPRRSKNDRVYSVWTLSDLDRVGPGAPAGCVKLFLFGNCHDKLWKETEGSVVAILGPKVMSDTAGSGTSSNGKDVSITLESPQHVMLLGQSPDFAVCAASADSNGRTCFRVVNKSICRFCEFHVKKAYYQASSSRPGFVITNANTFSQRGRRSQYAGDRQRPLCDPSIYSLPTSQLVPSAGSLSVQGRPLSVGRVKLSMSKLTAAGYQVDASVGLTSDQRRSADRSTEVDVEDTAVTAKFEPSGRSLTSAERKLLMALRRPTAGSLNLLRHLDASQADGQALSSIGHSHPTDSCTVSSTSRSGSKVSTTRVPEKQTGSVTFANFFASASQRQRSPSLAITPGGGISSKRPLPDELIDLGPLPSGSACTTVPSPLVNSSARRRATALVKSKGGLSAMQAEEVCRRRRATEVLAKSSRTAEHSPLSEILDINNKKKGTEEDLERSESARVQRAKRLRELAGRVEQGSSHTALLDEMENDAEQARLVQLEHRDDLQQRLMDQQEEPCTYVECKTCKYRAWKAAPQCRRDRHSLAYLKGTKRYYRCRQCSTRTATFERYPKLSCSNCGESLFEKTSIIPERRGPALPGEKLLPRGVEEKFLS